MVIVGGGVAGISAAIEAAGTGRVILVDAENRLGGSAWWGQAVTALPDAAAWPGEHPARTRYRSRVGADVIAWSEALGVQWAHVPAKSSGSPPLTAPVGGGRRLSDALWRTADLSGVEIHLSTRVTAIDADLTVHAGETRWRADAVILAAGGWAGELEGVRRRLGLPDVPLLGGGFPGADGSGIAMGAALGGIETTPAQAVLYGHGTPDPGNPERALVVLGTERMLAIDAEGTPQPQLRDSRGATGEAILAMPGGRAWGILDGPTLSSLQLQGSGVERRVLAKDAAIEVAADLPALAAAIGVPEESLLAGVPPLLPTGPYGALSLQPMAAKSLTGLSVDGEGRLLGADGAPITGLYAAGELAGFGGLYDDGVLLDSTMVAGAILSGRAAGRAVVADLAE
ncbi:MAG: putative oxidoreductase [Myxococcota bacterium]